MKSIEKIENIENKRVILRLDLNVPIKNGKITDSNRCLLYTSDAADDLTRVDLGGRRIIKKKSKDYNNFSCWKAKRKNS